MRKVSMLLAVSLAVILPAGAQNSSQQNGVSYWGQPAARTIYAPSPQRNVYAKPVLTPQSAYEQRLRLMQQLGGKVTHPLIPPAGVPAAVTTGKATAAASTATKTTTAVVAPNDGGGRSFTFELVCHGIRRNAIVHLPVGYDRRRTYPVVFVFHGLGMSSVMMPTYTGMSGAGDRNGFIVVYPNAIQGHWDDGFQADRNDDTGYFLDLLARLPKVANIDARRVYISGISQGGTFSERLSCEMPERISGIAIIAATGSGRVMNRSGLPPLPAMFFLGTADPLCVRQGEARELGKLGEVLNIPASTLGNGIGKIAGLFTVEEAVDYWLKRNGCSSTPRSTELPDRSNDGCRVRLDDYGSGRNEVAVYTVENGGHTWPGALPVAEGVMGVTTNDISASELICEFFRTR